MTAAVAVPRLIRGAGKDSGAAQMLVLAALANPGMDFLCSAPGQRLEEMWDEIVEVLTAALVAFTAPTRRTFVLPNRSRIIFRAPRRDGSGVHGILPHAIWVDGLDHFGEVEAVEMVHPDVVSVSIGVPL